jgi:CRISPR-associated protein Cpf1
MQIRNSDNKGNDFILSPVLSSVIAIRTNWKELIHFDSREYYKLTDKELPNMVSMPTSWDANGAFNIARKGLVMLKRIVENPEKQNLFVSDEEWDEFSTKH